MIAEAVAYLGNNMIPNSTLPGYVLYVAGILLYLGFAVQSINDEQFIKAFLHKQKSRTIKDLNESCIKLASLAKKHTNSTYYKKLRKVMDDRNEIYESYFRGTQNPLKEQIVEKTLNLVESYVKLLTNFCIRSREVADIKTDKIIARLNDNTRKVNFAQDPDIAENLNKMIELDRKMYDRVKNEKNELVKIKTKLDYMESSIGMFKHQIISNIESSETLDRLDDVIDEAIAMDTVLESRKKNRIRL